MTTIRPTPGPWTTHTDALSGDISVQSDDSIICASISSAADARLIAAAPAMRAALYRVAEIPELERIYPTMFADVLRALNSAYIDEE